MKSGNDSNMNIWILNSIHTENIFDTETVEESQVTSMVVRWAAISKLSPRGSAVLQC